MFGLVQTSGLGMCPSEFEYGDSPPAAVPKTHCRVTESFPIPRSQFASGVEQESPVVDVGAMVDTNHANRVDGLIDAVDNAVRAPPG